MRARHPRKDLPVIVLGAGITVLGAIRSLGKAGITAYCVSDTPGLEAASRWYRPIPPQFPRLADNASLEQYLAGLPFEKAVLLPCSDSWAIRVASLPRTITERFVTSGPPLDVLERFVDKAAFERTLVAHGIPHPTTYLPLTETDIEAIEGSLEGCFLKPRESQGFFRRFQVKGYWIRSRSDCIAHFRQLTGAGFGVMIQEYVPGPASNHYYVEGFVDRLGRTRAIFTRQRLRMYPSDFGNSTLMISVAREEVEPAIQSMEKLLGGVGFRGIFSAEFKRDAQSGIFKLIEVNARPWWYIEFATHCGMNVAEMAYWDALGEDLDPITSFARGRTSVNFYTDWQVWSRLPPEERPTISECAPAWLLGHHTVLSYSDPLPVVTWASQLAAGKLKSMIASSRGRLSRRHAPVRSTVSSG